MIRTDHLMSRRTEEGSASIRQKGRVGRFEAHVFGQLRRLKAEDDGVCAASQLSVELRVGSDRPAVDPDTRARRLRKLEMDRAPGCDLKFRPQENPDQSGVFVLPHRAMKVI